MSRFPTPSTQPDKAFRALRRKLLLLVEAAGRWGGPRSGAPVSFATAETSVHPDYLVCLETGQRVVLLIRHLQGLGLTFEDYRLKWGLGPDYPSAAPRYLAARDRVRAGTGADDAPILAHREVQGSAREESGPRSIQQQAKKKPAGRARQS
ncbi:MucR family transcriptional regulator [Solirhodobacter olei]|uniref:MucR family transcriptional regulator n=1 Tax=Solirhodobacter olei TaxID=2493082 RepID=UPI000FD9EBC3|nr:MucR family transcriptional regulator [Solirhodobacter olei]